MMWHSAQDIEPGMELMDAALFIDQSHDAMQKPAELKFGWGGELPLCHVRAT